MLAEDASKNRMQDSIQLFETICSNPIFEHTAIILFLNKTDLFLVFIFVINSRVTILYCALNHVLILFIQEKAALIDLGLFFPDYTDGCNPEPAMKFIQDTYRRTRRIKYPTSEVCITSILYFNI